MEKLKEKQVKVKGNKVFVWYVILMLSIFLVSVGLSIYDLFRPIVGWPEQYSDVIGVSSQIITAIVSLVVSIIGIAISLQNEDFFGVKITKLYALRVKKHYSILAIIVVSIILCVMNLAFYMIGFNFAALGTVVVALLFLMQVLFLEVPIMSKNETAILDIVKDNMISCYIKKEETNKDLKDAIKYLLYRKTLKETYDALKDEKDKQFNKYLLMEMLDIQQHLAFELKDSYNDYEQRIIAHSMLGNVFDVLFHHLGIEDEILQEIEKNRYLLTRVLFSVHELPSIKETWESKIQSMVRYLEVADLDTEKRDDMVSEILIVLVAKTIQEGDFSIIKAIRRQLSVCEYCLDKETPLLTFFVVISMYLYYLQCCDSDVPDDVKKQIETFINEGGAIEDRTRILSWKELFSIVAEDFEVDYDKLMSLSSRTSTSVEYYLLGIGTKAVVLHKPFYSTWYLTNLFNAQRLFDINYTELCNRYPDIKDYLKDFGKKCLDENGCFSPTKEMEEIATFYSDSSESFVLFRIGEERNHGLFDFVNGLLIEELANETNQAKQLDNDVFADEIRNEIELAVKNEWGFDQTLSIENDSRCFSVLFEKMPKAYNFEETIIKYSVDSVFSDLRKTVKKTMLFNNDDFEREIRLALSKKPKYTTENTKNIIPHYFLRDKELQNSFLEYSKDMIEIKSRLMGKMFLLVGERFRFNLVVEKVEITQLSDEEIAEKVASYQRADGQFVYEGVFLPKETITDLVRSKFVVLTVVIKHQVVSFEEDIFELNPYSKGLKE